MSLNSVNTNMGAMVALQSLNMTNTELQATEKQISTGYRVADATDDGAAYAVAQGVRSNVAALTSANQQLQDASGLVGTAVTGLTSISKMMSTVQSTLITLANGGDTGTERALNSSQLKTELSTIKTYITDSNYNGKTLIGNFGAAPAGYGNVSVVRNEQGASYTINAFNASAIYNALTSLATSTGTTQVAAAVAALGTAGVFTTQSNSVNAALSKYGNASNFLNGQVTFNSDRIDSMNAGMGALIDANLSQEAANLQALQTRQQLGTQALSLANQAPNSLLSLFK